MNQRVSNCRSDTAMPSSQFVERSDGCRIAQHNGNLTSFATQRRLTLRASLCLGHESVRRGEQCAAVTRVDGLRASLVQPKRNAAGVNVNPFTSGSDKHHFGQFRRDVGGVRVGGTDLHDYLRSGPIPPMNASYAVTSDVSTLILQAAK